MQKRERPPDFTEPCSQSKLQGLSCEESTADHACESSSADNINPNRGACDCHVIGCSQSFASVADYEDHYWTCHSYVCRYCRRFFPSHHLLEIHLLETHDSLFPLLAKKQPMFQCIVESCQERFIDQHVRQEHLTLYHKYPQHFQLDRRRRSRLTDVTGGREENRDVEVSHQTRQPMVSVEEAGERSVPDSITFGIGESEIFSLPYSSAATGDASEDPMDAT